MRLARVAPHTGSALLLAGAAALSASGGCASFGVGAGSDAGCNSILTGVIGAAAGAVLDSRSRVAGAAIGGAVGALACVTYNYATRQKRPAAEVEKDYASRNGALPEQTQVLHYSASMQPTTTVTGGGTATLVTDVELVKGRNSPQPKVEEALEMRGPDGKVVNTARKSAAIKGSGEFENQFRFTLPQGVDEGIYPVDLTLYVDGEKKDAQSLRMQVASDGGVRWFAAR